MKGIYVLDLTNGHMCMVLAQDYHDAQLQAEAILTTLDGWTFEGSYHYYPILTEETDREAERRVYVLLGKRWGLDSVYTHKEFMESIGKGTYGPEMELRKMMDVSSVDSLKSKMEDKEVFSMSI